jgi:ankyrin repeat protein
MWISHARRPLDVRELQHAMATRLEDTDIDQDNIPSLRTLLDCCCGLVEVDHGSNIIRLVHHSLEEYLRDQDHGLFKDANVLITKVCLRYLTFDSVRALPQQNRTAFAASMLDLAFLGYAANEWGYHAFDIPAVDIEEFAIPALTSSETLFTIARARDFGNLDFRKWTMKTLAWAQSGGGGVSLCAEFGLTELLTTLIDKNPEHGHLTARNFHGSTPLHEAALNGHEHTARVLIDHGSDILDTNYGNSTPLFLAASYGQFSMVKFLLSYGRDQLDCPGPREATALHKAVEQGSLEMVRVMLEAGALVATHDSQGCTPLHVAAKRGYISIAEVLVSAGAFVHVKDKEYLCPLDYAATGGYAELVEFLADNGGSIKHKGRELWTPLHRAARRGHPKSVNLLLNRDANLLADDFRGQIPLHLAVRSGSMETVVALLSHQPALKRQQLLRRDRKESTAREVAFYTAHYDIHKYLRAAEWATLGIEPSNASLITTAIEAGDIDRVRELLIKDQSAINTPDEDGQPLLHVAIQENKKDIVALLLQHGASIEAKGYHGWHALHIAASLGSLELVDLCLQHNANVAERTNTKQTPLHKAASTKSVPVLRRLLDAGADPMAQNERGMTALHIAAHQNRMEAVRLLILEYGVDVFTRDRQGLTASMWAERSAHLEVTSFLHKEMKKAKVLRKNTPELPAAAEPLTDLELAA